MANRNKKGEGCPHGEKIIARQKKCKARVAQSHRGREYPGGRP